MQYLKQSFFPVHSYNKKREPTKDEAEPRRVVWRGADAYLGRAEGRCLRCRPHCFCSPGYWPGVCPRQLWAELISVVREPPPLSTQFPFPLPKPWAFLFLLTYWACPQPLHWGKKLQRYISIQWELFHLSFRDQTRAQWQKPHSASLHPPCYHQQP